MEFKNKEIVFANCSPEYFMEFGFSFIGSSLFHQNSTHIHIINPTKKINEILSTLKNKNSLFTFSHSQVDFSKMSKKQIDAYYLFIRFLIVPDFFKIDKEIKMLMMDIDTIIKKPIIVPKEPVGIFLREYHEDIRFKAMGGIVYVDNNGINFMHELNKLLSHYMKNGNMLWYADQIALYETYKKVSNKNDIHIFTEEYFSWSNHENAYAWTAKGNRKNTDTLFLNEKKYFENIFKSYL